MLTDPHGVYIGDEIFQTFTKGTPSSIVDYIDNYLFKTWKARETCICVDDLKQLLNLDDTPTEDKISEEFILIYCEYAANMVYLLKSKIAHKDDLSDIPDAILHNLKILLDWYNHEIVYDPLKEKAIVVAKNASATAVVELLDNALSYSVVEYNHFLLKGNINKKKAILLALGNDLEPKRDKLRKIDKELTDCIFFMLNNLDLRHNNRTKGDKYYKEKIARMHLSTLEKWYDELYQLMLSAYMSLENIKRIAKIKTLKSTI